jgi:hypothetical protein
LTTAPKLTVKKVYEYDLTTEAGKEYQVARVGSDIEDIQSSVPASSAVSTYDLNGIPATSSKGIQLQRENKKGQSTYRKILKR